ncbi:hypothetical protein [Mycolicibacterium phlei]|nr:hypothetical protein [Mycolicibacterium phlei]KXW74864.1 hypothetical protein JL15_25605 [Mycolicibacterium phlei DSM 43071]
MRMAVLIATVLVAGCSTTTAGQPMRIEPIPPASSKGGTSTSPTAEPTTPPEPGAPVADVIAWIDAGEPIDVEQFRQATREGELTQLGDDVAFTTPSGKTTCMTDSQYSGGALACLVDLVNPPPRPEDAVGEWKGGWVDYDGPTVSVGSIHGDPGRFTAGQGPELPYGQLLAFGDYGCRADTAGLFCANYANQTAVKFSDAGIEPFGCLQQVDAPPLIGEFYTC